MNAAPYPGLRPFKTEEAYIFFGREKHTDQLIEKLSDTRFIAVLGLSGCGKSSLVRAGMIAGLESGYMAKAGSDWQILTMRPGSHPMHSLAKALLEHPDLKLALPDQQGKSPQISEEEFAFSIASRGPMGLVEVLRESGLSEQRNLLLLVDQFEELFRYPERKNQDEREAFVAMLLSSAEQRESPIYIVVTMRSDFIGDCSQFRGLPEVMDQGQYLTPRLTREQLRTTIIGPARVFGGSVEARLVEGLFKDMRDDPDQLPVLQHCLMRMWHKAKERIGDNEEISLDLKDYEHVGGIKDALSNHADEAFHELTPKQQEIAEILFRRITERSPDLRDKRHPVPLREIAAVGGVSTADVAAVAERFRRADRCFLTPSPVDCETVQDDTDLDISHESLIRQWKQLNKWVAQEAESAETYQRVEQTARLWKEGKAALWSTPDLDIALKWREEEKPTSEWAKRYGSHFDLSIEFLDASAQAQEEKHKQEEQERQKKLRHTRGLLALALIGFLIALSLALWAFWERSNAEKARTETKQALITAEERRQEAEKNRKLAEKQQQRALESEKKEKKAKEEAESLSLTYLEMIKATYEFEKNNRRGEEYLSWLISQSKSMDDAKQRKWYPALYEMDESARKNLLNLLGKEAIGQKLFGQFRIDKIVITDITGQKKESINYIYSVKVGETITISVYFTAPDNYEIEVTWTARYGKISSNSQKTTTSTTENFYTAEKSGGDYVIVYIWDQETGEELQEPINITVVP